MNDALTHDVVVAVTTFQRPRQLSECLPHVVAQARESAHRVRVLVVDNDRNPSARPYVDALPGTEYVHEPRPGVSAARNTAVAAAGDAEALIFLDDDTVPAPGWLDAMVGLWTLTRPAAVTGSATFTFDSDEHARYAHEWGEFLEVHRPTGTACASAASRNLLLDPAFLAAHALRFDESLGLIGGEDTLLTRQIVAAGGRILWCEEARVAEPVPASRVSREWILRRAYRSGGSWALSVIRTSAAGPRRTRWRLGGRAAAIIVARTVTAGAAAALRRRQGARRAWRDAAAQVGVLAICGGLRGMREYGRTT